MLRFWHQFLLSSQGGLEFSSRYDGLFDTTGIFLALFQFSTDSCCPLSRCRVLWSNPSLNNHQSMETVIKFSGKCSVLQYKDVSTVLCLYLHKIPSFPVCFFIVFLASFTSFTSMQSELPSLSLLFISPLFSRLPVTVCVSPSAVSLPTVQQRKRSVAGREPAKGWRCFLSLQSRTNWQNGVCKICAGSRSHPSSFFVHLHLNSSRLWMPKQLRSQHNAKRGVNPPAFWSLQ